MRRLAPALLVLLALTGCASEPPPPPAPGPRVLVESQVRAFTDRALVGLQQDPDSIVRSLASRPDATLPGTLGPYRDQVEEWGRNTCSHLIAGVPVEDAFAAAYPRDPANRSPKYLAVAQAAADVLCPTT